ncbi:MAG: hydantoinase/oxoprolinase family protein [Eggerthellaceae bacterium]|nr:hydantoinase/oxoprolinase family protein [Eggerthellaceae bacterium]
MIRLGIDTGGTFTDAVVVDTRDMNVLAKAKSLTTKGDLTRCIGTVLDRLPHEVLARAEQAALSTTLATNACVEGKGGRARLVIVGTTDEILRRVDAQGKFGIPYSDVLAIDFKGSYDGNDVTIPDWEALYEQHPAFFEEADSFGIASLYALNNGAIVEKSGAEFLRRRFGKLVVEATTVAVEPNVIGRGATALLNARLVPVIEEFLDAITAVFAARGLDIPVSIVRSDGTLMSEGLARIRPVETILSGPAASVTGACALAGAPESLVVDIGGTTSDLSIVHRGRPNRTDGIVIGGWKTQVAGVHVDTIALGGDTVVRYTKNSRLELGTRRVTPICIAASRWPGVVPALESYYAKACADFHARYEMLYLLRDPGDVTRFNRPEQQLLELLREGPMPQFDRRMEDILGLKTDRLEDEGIVMRIGLTPTDAMHVRGDFDEFDAKASKLGMQCVLKSYRGEDASHDEREIMALADEIYDLAQHRLFSQAVRVFAQDRYWPDEGFELDGQMASIVKSTWQGRHGERQPFNIVCASDATLVGVGAPTHVLIGEVAQVLGAPRVVPEHAGVANAIGAAASHVSVEQQVRVTPLRGADGVLKGYQVRSLEGIESFADLEEALQAAREAAKRQAIEEARRRGAQEAVQCEIIEDRSVYTATGVMEIAREWTITARVE